ncbi:MAG: AI-2E family transporter [Marinilabiliaceae bacterium]|nr:AI-2E family transporter [Marinilabiliaceae bacterium]
MKDLKTTNTLLLILVIPLIFYILKILSFIFIPLILSMFISLLFLPIMRWLSKKRVPRFASIIIIVLIIAAGLKIGGILIKLTSEEIIASKDVFFEKAEVKVMSFVTQAEDFFGIVRIEGDNVIQHYLKGKDTLKNFGSTINFISNTLTMTLMTVFFAVLLLAGSVNFEKVLNSTLFRLKYASVKTFRKIEKDLIKFVIVKFFISLFTGIGFSIACLFFDISFPLFWGLFAFVINFVQMIGSVISVVLLSLFAFVEIDFNSTLLFFIFSIIVVQVVMGSILEPVFMGKTFAVNVITILVMLMLWGYIWGIPGLIMSIPITVFFKIVLEQFPKTKIISELMAVPNINTKRKILK